MDPVPISTDDHIRRNNSTGRRSNNQDFHYHESSQSSPYTGPTRSVSVGSSRRPLRPTSQDDRQPREELEGPAEIRRPDSSTSPGVRRYGSQSRPPRAYNNRPSPHWTPGPTQRESVRDLRADAYVDAQSEPHRCCEINHSHHISRHNVHPQDEEMGYTRDGIDPQRGGFHHPSGSLHSRPALGWGNMTKDEKREIMRLPWLQWMNSNIKNHFVAAVGEFVGTTMFLFFAFAGTIVANTQSRAAAGSQTTTGSSTGFDVGVLMYIALSFGFSLMVNAWVFFRISGGLFNPAVTLGMMLVKAVSPARAAWLLLGQLGGAISASAITMALFPSGFNVRTTLSPGATVVQGIFIEALLTAELVFTIFMLAQEKHRATFMAPIGIGLALFIAELVGVQYTGGSLNPARSFGPCVVTATFDAEHWIYCEY